MTTTVIIYFHLCRCGRTFHDTVFNTVLFQGLKPQTPHLHWSINVSRPEILLLFLHRSWKLLVSVIPQGIPRCCLLFPPYCLAILVVLTASTSRGKTCLICWRGSIKLDWCHWHVAIDGWLDKFMYINVGTANFINHCLCITFGDTLWTPLRDYPCSGELDSRLP